MRGEIFLLLLSFVTVKTEINHTFILGYESYTIPDLRYMCLNYEITDAVSEKCSEQLEVVCENLDIFGTMLDATSKFPYAGLGYASKSDYGNFDQCMTIDYKYTGGRILGKYCNAGLLIPDIFDDMTDPSTYYRLAVCKPDACSADDFNAIASNITEGLPLIFLDAACQTVETNKEFSASDIITTLIFAVVILLMILSTIYDVYLYMKKSKSHHQLLLAFSVWSNGKKLIQVSRNSKQQIQTFHGIKVISMMWIVAGHGFSMLQVAPLTNVPDSEKWMKARYSEYIAAGPLAVDTFFFISGYLLAFQYFKQKVKPLRKQVLSVPHMYLHRYLRLTPALLMTFLVTLSILKHLGTGPIYPAGAATVSQACRDNWWSFFLYIQNYVVDFDDMCLGHTWYLSVDMQMFLLSPLVLIPISLNLRKSSGFKASMVELLILNIFCIFLPMILKLLIRSYTNEYDTHSRLTNYFIGVMLAVFMRIKFDKPFLYMIKNKHKSIINLVTWIVILLGMIAVVICYQEIELYHGYDSRSVFQSLMRPAWCIGLSWIVYSCYHGYGGIVNWILSGPFMQVLGKLTYCIYLTHVTVLMYYIFRLRNNLYFSDFNVFYAWCGHFTVTVILSTFWTLAFESPLIIIEKYLLGGGYKKAKPPLPANGDGEMKRENVY